MCSLSWFDIVSVTNNRGEIIQIWAGGGDLEEEREVLQMSEAVRSGRHVRQGSEACEAR